MIEKYITSPLYKLKEVDMKIRLPCQVLSLLAEHEMGIRYMRRETWNEDLLY
jgi:hypothetical protein